MKLKVGIKSFTVKTIPFLFKKKIKIKYLVFQTKLNWLLKIKVVHMYMTDWQAKRNEILLSRC